MSILTEFCRELQVNNPSCFVKEHYCERAQRRGMCAIISLRALRNYSYACLELRIVYVQEKKIISSK